jgi:hypothetical protein
MLLQQIFRLLFLVEESGARRTGAIVFSFSRAVVFDLDILSR